MAMVSCGSSRTWTPCLGSRGGDEDGSSGCALTLYIPWLRCSSKALQPFLGIVFGWVVGAKSWQLSRESVCKMLTRLFHKTVQSSCTSLIRVGFVTNPFHKVFRRIAYVAF